MVDTNCPYMRAGDGDAISPTTGVDGHSESGVNSLRRVLERGDVGGDDARSASTSSSADETETGEDEKNEGEKNEREGFESWWRHGLGVLGVGIAMSARA